MRQIVQANATEYCRHQVGYDEANLGSADEMARLIMQEARGGQHGGVNAFTILAEYVGVRVDVYDKIGDHVQHIQDEHTSLPLINLVRVDPNQP